MANTRGDYQTTIYFPDDDTSDHLYQWLKAHAVDQRTSLTAVVVRACQKYRTEQEDRTP